MNSALNMPALDSVSKRAVHRMAMPHRANSRICLLQVEAVIWHPNGRARASKEDKPAGLSKLPETEEVERLRNCQIPYKACDTVHVKMINANVFL